MISDFCQIKWKRYWDKDLVFGQELFYNGSQKLIQVILIDLTDFLGKRGTKSRMTNSVCRNSITPLPDSATKVSTLFKFQQILKLSSSGSKSVGATKSKLRTARKHGHVTFEEDFNNLNELLKKWAIPYNPRRRYCYGDHNWECWVRRF